MKMMMKLGLLVATVSLVMATGRSDEKAAEKIKSAHGFVTVEISGGPFAGNGGKKFEV